MLVEGTQTISRTRGDLGVPARATSLSSSSSIQPDRSSRGPAKGEEESSFTGTRVEDSITLSLVAESAAARPAGVGQTAPYPRGAEAPTETGKETADSNIKQSIEQTNEQEQERLDQIARAVDERLNDNLSLRFRQDEETGEEIFQLVEQETGDVVRQIPAEEVLEFMKKFEESVSGLFISEQA